MVLWCYLGTFTAASRAWSTCGRAPAGGGRRVLAAVEPGLSLRPPRGLATELWLTAGSRGARGAGARTRALLTVVVSVGAAGRAAGAAARMPGMSGARSGATARIASVGSGAMVYGSLRRTSPMRRKRLGRSKLIGSCVAAWRAKARAEASRVRGLKVARERGLQPRPSMSD